MRQVNNDEAHMLQTRGIAVPKIAEIAVCYSEQENFTICKIEDDTSEYLGVSKRNPRDAESKAAGRNIAFLRAVDNMIGEING